MSRDTGETPRILLPRENPVLLGHEAAERELLAAFRGDRLSHAWLITGPPGVGKATLAYRFARYVLAHGEDGRAGLFGAPAPPESLDLDPGHPVFRRVAAGGHADLMTVERSVNDRGRLRSEIVVEDARRLGAFLHLTAAEGGWRIAVIDAADELNRNAANAVLKLLEEPPARTLILLISHSPGRLLPTIRSRCRRLPLQTLKPEVVVRAIAAQIRDVPAAQREAAARLAEGSPGRAVAMLLGGGVSLYRDMIGLLRELPALDMEALHEFCDQLARSDERFPLARELILWWLGRVVRTGATGVAGQGMPDDAVPGDVDLVVRVAGQVPADCRAGLWGRINDLFDRGERANLDRKLVLLGAFLAMESSARG